MNSNARLFLTPILLAVFALSACAPAVPSPTPEAIPATSTPAQSAATAASAPTQSEVRAEPSPEASATFVPTATALPVATSRGPNLEATDPTTVTLAAGQLQLVEFFRFT
ncbi:MAG: hypothetical protein AB1750_18910 [Chloroflexota bacterium]